jgi:hypothetical protein
MAGEKRMTPRDALRTGKRRLMLHRKQVRGQWERAGRTMTSPVSRTDIDRVPGWFYGIDQLLFCFALEESANQVGLGDLAEIGVYRGKSAILVGAFRRPGETFTVVDLFEEPAADDANLDETSAYYSGLTQKQFEGTYKHIHHDLPSIFRGPSDLITQNARLGTHRFIHIDGSHLYDQVVTDIESSKQLAAPQGFVVLDDFRTEHTPGVAAAAWGSLNDGFNPIFLSAQKMYGTWGDSEPWIAAFIEWTHAVNIAVAAETINGRTVHRVVTPVA